PTPMPTPTPFVPFTIGFTGDISYAETYYQGKHLSTSSGVYNRAKERGRTLDSLIDREMLDEMRRVDLLVVNCESSVSSRGEPLGLKGKEYSFRTSPETAKMFKSIGADLVGLANNHVYDFGRDAFLDTLSTFEEMGIPTFGAGKNASEAYEPYYYTQSGVTVALIATSCAEKNYFTPVAEEDAPGICGCYDDTLVCEKIREAKTKADFVVVYPHYGREGTSDVIEDKQRLVSRHFIDAGADLVIGGHAHRIQGIESYKGKLIFWNLGNFLFNNGTFPTMLVELTFTGEAGYALRVLPGVQTDGRVESKFGTEEGEEILQFLRVRSPGVAIDKNGYVYDCTV
ncbi:MAG: CapA family protein, partial [Clostridia bacterium]|nr:CapA family protein [Clostridia bacterium]